MNVKAPDEARHCIPISGDSVAIVGENRKMLVFPITDIPELARGKGVRLQRYKDGGVSDIRVFTMDQGLTWQDASGRSFTRGKLELLEWACPARLQGAWCPKVSRARVSSPDDPFKFVAMKRE